MAITWPCLGATKHLYNWLCPSVGRSVCLSVTHSFDDQHVAPYWPTWPCFLVARFISAIEGKEYPFYGLQFHPEKNPFEWKPSLKGIRHTESAVKVTFWI